MVSYSTGVNRQWNYAINPQLVLVALTGVLHSDELIYCFDPAPLDPGSWAQPDHCDHVHLAYKT